MAAYLWTTVLLDVVMLAMPQKLVLVWGICADILFPFRAYIGNIVESKRTWLT